MIALVSVMGKASRSKRRKWANKVKGVVAERAENHPRPHLSRRTTNVG
jgi:hypothetical protein